MQLIENANLAPQANIIDVGGGASTLIDDLLERGFQNVTVLDISANAIETTRRRLGPKAGLALWETGDITQTELPEKHFDLWHDRAVFHFLTEAKDRELYTENLRRSLKPNGHFIISTFADDGPLKCSGLEVERYSIEKLQETIGPDLQLIEAFREAHQTPFNTVQSFLYAQFIFSA